MLRLSIYITTAACVVGVRKETNLGNRFSLIEQENSEDQWPWSEDQWLFGSEPSEDDSRYQSVGSTGHVPGKRYLAVNDSGEKGGLTILEQE